VAFGHGAEFDRQVDNLLRLGYPALAGLTVDEFTALVVPLRAAAAQGAAAQGAAAGRVPFLLVVTADLVSADKSMPLTALAGSARPGSVNRLFGPGELARFAPVDTLDLPAVGAYLVRDVERGEEFCGVAPDGATAAIGERGRTPLTVDEGIAFITHHPGSLEKNRCFSLAGSRCGDRRVPALWISKGAPTLGWCWAGNPHSWLGCASAGDRTAGVPVGAA
jgi:hypothetical protein